MDLHWQQFTEYTNPFSIVAGQTPTVVKLPLSLAEVPVIKEAATEVTACVAGVDPVPVSEFVGELLPTVALATVIIAVFAPTLEGVKITL
jgi:hypothetical protein